MMILMTIIMVARMMMKVLISHDDEDLGDDDGHRILS